MDFEIVHQILLRLSRIVGVVSINILIDAMIWGEIGYNELVTNIICYDLARLVRLELLSEDTTT